MKYSNEMMLMIAQFLYGGADAKDFSYDFPDRLADIYEEFNKENPELCDLLEEEMPEICGFFDMHGTGDRFTYPEDIFRDKVMAVYQKAVSIASMKKVS